MGVEIVQTAAYVVSVFVNTQFFIELCELSFDLFELGQSFFTDGDDIFGVVENWEFVSGVKISDFDFDSDFFIFLFKVLFV